MSAAVPFFFLLRNVPSFHELRPIVFVLCRQSPHNPHSFATARIHHRPVLISLGPSSLLRSLVMNYYIFDDAAAVAKAVLS